MISNIPVALPVRSVQTLTVELHTAENKLSAVSIKLNELVREMPVLERNLSSTTSQLKIFASREQKILSNDPELLKMEEKVSTARASINFNEIAQINFSEQRQTLSNTIMALRREITVLINR